MPKPNSTQDIGINKVEVDTISPNKIFSTHSPQSNSRLDA